MMWLMKIFSKGNKKRAGFTLIELMIVVIVVGILAAAAIPIYSRVMDRAYASEGKALLGTIRTHYLTEDAEDRTLSVPTDLNVDWGIDTSKNKWWRVMGTDFNIDWTTPKATITGLAANTYIGNIQLRIDCDTGQFWESFDYLNNPLPSP